MPKAGGGENAGIGTRQNTAIEDDSPYGEMMAAIAEENNKLLNERANKANKQSLENYYKAINDTLSAMYETNRINSANASEAWEKYKNFQKESNEWLAMREDTSVQRFMKQLQENGINPKMVVNAISGLTSTGSTASVASPSVPSISNPTFSQAQTFMAQADTESKREYIKSMINASTSLTSTDKSNLNKLITTGGSSLVSLIGTMLLLGII